MFLDDDLENINDEFDFDFSEDFLLKKEDEEESVYTIDRFEGEYAVCENRKTESMVNIKKAVLPSNVKEGSILKYKNGEYSIDIDEQEEVSNRILKKMNDLWED